MDALDALGRSPLLAAVGLLVVLAILLAPIALRLAGLSGGQIAELLKSTMSFVVLLIREFRTSNKQSP